MTSLPGAGGGLGRPVLEWDVRCTSHRRLRRPVGPVATENWPTLTMRHNTNNKQCNGDSGKGNHIGLQTGTGRARREAISIPERTEAFIIQFREDSPTS